MNGWFQRYIGHSSYFFTLWLVLTNPIIQISRKWKMMFKKHMHSKKHDNSVEKAISNHNPKAPTKEELDSITLQMNLCASMLPPSFFPYGYWYFH